MSAPVLGPWQFCASRADWQICHRARTHAPFPGIRLQVRTCQGQDSRVHASGSANHTKASRISVRVLVMWVHPTVSMHGKPSCVGWRRTLTCSNTQLGGRLGASKLLPIGLVVLQTFLHLAWGSLQTPQESQT